MKKVLTLAMAGLVLIAAIIFVPSVQTLAVSALSIFRVDETKSIKITLADLEEMIAYFQQYGSQAEGRRQSMEKFAGEHPDFAAKQFGIRPDIMGKSERPDITRKPERPDKTGKPERPYGSDIPVRLDQPDKMKVREPAYRTLNSIREFRAFSIQLPKVLEGEQPVMYALDQRAKSFTLDVAAINQHLADKGFQTQLDEAYDGTEVTVNLPPALLVKYSEVILLATQGIALEAPKEMLNSLWADVLALPFIPENIRGQLAEIDLQSRDVYLPVLLGIGRETVIGSSVGYIYSTEDLAQLRTALPAEMQGAAGTEAFAKRLDGQEAGVLIWTKNGVLYVLGGPKTDSELTEIARSIR